MIIPVVLVFKLFKYYDFLPLLILYIDCNNTSLIATYLQYNSAKIHTINKFENINICSYIC